MIAGMDDLAPRPRTPDPCVTASVATTQRPRAPELPHAAASPFHSLQGSRVRNPLGFLWLPVLVCVLCGGAATRASAQASPAAPDSLEYQRMVTALRSGERDIDFTRLRMAQVASNAYAPY